MLAGWAQGKEANFLLPMCVATLDLVVAVPAMPAMAAEAAAANQQLTSRVRPHKKVPAPLFFFLFSFFFFPANSSSNPGSTSYVVELV